MALESATYINQLVAANPTLSDPKAQGDDHIRMIKSVLQSTFPGLTGAVTATQAQLNTLTDPTLFFKPGMIIIWNGQIANIPTGWKLCNGVGTISNGDPVPNLMDRFILGAGNSVLPGGIGGTLQHTHSISVNGTSLTTANLPPHTHPAPTAGGFVVSGTGAGNTVGGSDIGNAAATGSTGSGTPHTHTAFASNGDNIPPFMALAYIIKN